ncbi:MAG: CoA transferase [Dehalococcoidia bacterium]
MSDPRPLPLAGIRVADFFWLIAGPATSRVLADCGADVIKIESHARLDNIRLTGPQPSEPGSLDTNAVFNDVNTNKRSVTLNLGTPRGVELAKEIVRHSDIVTNNFTGDRMDRWGMGYEALRAIKPDIIMLTMPVMGTTGPYVRYGAYGNGVIGYGGMRTNMGFPGRPPVGIAPLYSDFSAPYFAVSALMAALYHRERTGEGQFIDLAQMESAVSLLGTGVLEYTANGHIPEPPGNRARDYAPHGAYPCWGADRWCAIAVRDDAEWRALCAAIDLPALADDPRFATLADRKRNEDELDALIAGWTRERDAWQITHLLQSRGVIAGVVEDLEDMLIRDPQLPVLHFERLQREDEAVAFTTHRQPARFDGASLPLRRGPRMGEHNEEVLTGLLGLSHEEYVQLLIDRVVY